MSSTVQMTELYDNALLGILQHVGNIQNFLQIYFGFLYRKTDFYRLLSSPNDRMGFPHGVAEKMVLKAFRMFDQVATRDRERTAQEAELRRARETAATTAPLPVQEVLVESEQEVESVVENKEESADATPPLEVQIPPLSTEPVGNDAAPSPEGDQATPCPETATAECGQAQFQENPDSYNGAVRDNYSWSQDYTDVEVRVFVPANVIKGKQVSVNLQPGRLRVAVREGAEERLLVDGELSHRINMETSLWSLEPGKCVLLSLTKCGEVWWNAILKGEKEIDVNQINRERSMASVDEEEHAVLDRLTFDYRQKLQGQPQSHEMKVHEMLKKGWDAEGSPFKGQTFDASMFDIPASAVQL